MFDSYVNIFSFAFVNRNVFKDNTDGLYENSNKLFSKVMPSA